MKSEICYVRYQLRIEQNTLISEVNATNIVFSVQCL